jgi:ankyrin repeat protein
VLALGEVDVGRGEGPLWQPPHQYCFEFARLLLEAGADPNDNQGLYNRMQFPDDEHLKLLFEFGLGKDQGGPWFKRFFQHWPRVDNRSPSDILSYQLRYAVGANYFDRVKLLVENGADVNRTSQYPAGARAPYAEAVYHGNQEIADYLVAKGAKRIALSTKDAFAAACNRADADRARELVASDPSLLDDAGELLISAADEGRANSLRLLVALGVDVNGEAGRASPLFSAARAGQLDTVKLLVELGADVDARDPDYDATPLGAANYKDQRNVVEYLLQFARIWDAVTFGGLDRVRTLLRENPECVNVRDDEACTPLHYPNSDTRHGAQIIELLIAHGADIKARDNAGRTPVEKMLQNGRRDLAEILRRHGGDST